LKPSQPLFIFLCPLFLLSQWEVLEVRTPHGLHPALRLNTDIPLPSSPPLPALGSASGTGKSLLSKTQPDPEQAGHFGNAWGRQGTVGIPLKEDSMRKSVRTSAAKVPGVREFPSFPFSRGGAPGAGYTTSDQGV